MAKYRKKPVVIEAVIWEGWKSQDDIRKFNGGQNWTMTVHRLTNTYSLNIPTLEGVMLANEGDYIIKGIAGEFYPCKPDIFNNSYEVVRD